MIVAVRVRCPRTVFSVTRQVVCRFTRRDAAVHFVFANDRKLYFAAGVSGCPPGWLLAASLIVVFAFAAGCSIGAVVAVAILVAALCRPLSSFGSTLGGLGGPLG